MGTLFSELASHAERLTAGPRVYADANVPARAVAYMRNRLGWDVLFVLEVDHLRRASDISHYRLAHQLHRTLLTFDRDYLDDRRFPPAEGCGVLVVQAPDDRRLMQLLDRIDRRLFRPRADGEPAGTPLAGRKLQLHVDWGRPERHARETRW